VIDFIYINKIKKLIEKNKIKIFNVCKDEVDNVRGITFENNDIWINLSANQWKQLNEEILITEITKTIIHENIHNIFNNKNIIKNEEHICKLMAGQI